MEGLPSKGASPLASEQETDPAERAQKLRAELVELRVRPCHPSTGASSAQSCIGSTIVRAFIHSSCVHRQRVRVDG